MIEGKNVLAVIPARGGSKGIKLKNLIKINGKTLTAIAIKIAKSVDLIDEIVVSTDHKAIVDEAKRCGLKVPFLRPEYLSGDRIGDIDVLLHALIEAEKQYSKRFDIVIMLQPTSPLRTSENIKNAVFHLLKGNYSSVWSVSETDSKSHPLKQLVVDDSSLNYYDPAGSKIIARQQLSPVFHRNGVVYVFSRECIVESKNKMGPRCGYLIIDQFNISIDTLDDVEFIEYQISKNKIPEEAAVFS